MERLINNQREQKEVQMQFSKDIESRNKRDGLLNKTIETTPICVKKYTWI